MSSMTIVWLTLGAIAGLFVLAIIKWILSLRVVVPTNQVHIVQRAKGATSYGKDSANGNTYYRFPIWIPVLGVVTTEYPISVFDIELIDYDAYDQGRLPFLVDVKAFFRIDDSDMAAGRVSSFDELKQQLMDIVRGTVRSLLAKSELELIMSERSQYGQKFTEEVSEQLKHWGVTPVKAIELMDIRDAKGSEVIANIMAKKKSQIEMESRTEVALNSRKAQEAEIIANKEVALKDEQAKQEVGIKQAEVKQLTGLRNEEAQQKINEAKEITTQKEMGVTRVATVENARIAKEAAVVKGEESKEILRLDSEAKLIERELQAQSDLIFKKTNAEADLVIATKNAEGIQLEGESKAIAEKLMQQATVAAQIALAKEIGQNEGYQSYLISIRRIESEQSIGEAYAGSMNKADIKIIANAGNAAEGISKVSEIISPKGGLSIASMIEAFQNTDAGKAIMDVILKRGEEV